MIFSLSVCSITPCSRGGAAVTAFWRLPAAEPSWQLSGVLQRFHHETAICSQQNQPLLEVCHVVWQRNKPLCGLGGKNRGIRRSQILIGYILIGRIKTFLFFYRDIKFNLWHHKHEHCIHQLSIGSYRQFDKSPNKMEFSGSWYDTINNTYWPIYTY